MVGGVKVYDDKNGNLWDRSRVGTPENGVTVDVYAPSYLINCANNAGGFRIREEVTGTSLGNRKNLWILPPSQQGSKQTNAPLQPQPKSPGCVHTS